MMSRSRARTEMKITDFEYRWTISNFSFCNKEPGHMLVSPTFTIKDTKITGCLQLYPGGVSEKFKNHVAVYLQLTGEENSEVTAMFTLDIVTDYDTRDIFCKSELGNFSDHAHGFEQFVERSFLMCEDNGLLEDDELTIECHVSVNTGVVNHSYDISDAEVKSIQRVNDDFGQILEDKLFTDVVLAIEEEEFAVHKAILAAKSRVFEQMFIDWPDERTFEINDISAKMMRHVLKFLYTGKVDIVGIAAKDFLAIAESYQFLNSELQVICETEMLNNINPKNATVLLIFAHEYSLDKMEQQVVDYIIEHSHEIVQTCTYKDTVISHPHLVDLLFRSLSSKINKCST